MKKRLTSFILVIQLSAMFLYGTAIAENKVPVLDTGQTLNTINVVKASATDETPLPSEKKLPSPTEEKYLPPEETDERRKLQSRWLRKDEADNPHNRYNGSATLPKKHEIPRRLRLPGSFLYYFIYYRNSI